MKTTFLPPFFAQFTDEQLRAQYRKNTCSLREMADKAKLRGRKVNGFSHGELASMIDRYEAVSRGNFIR